MIGKYVFMKNSKRKFHQIVDVGINVIEKKVQNICSQASPLYYQKVDLKQS
jgi:hypothetical protein